MYRFVKLNPPFDITKNFWTENFQISLIEPFKKLYDRDESPDKSVSSKEMWCIWLMVDASVDNKLYRQPEQQKKSAVLSYLPTFDFKDPDIAACLMAYPECCMSDAKREYDSAIKSLRVLTDSISNRVNTEELTLDEVVTFRNNRGTEQDKLVKGKARQILELLERCDKQFMKFEKVKQMFLEEEAQVILYGGGELSLVEEGGLMELNDDDDYE